MISNQLATRRAPIDKPKDRVWKTIRVLNVLPEERLGGPALRVLQVARRLQGKGFETHVVTPKGDPRFAALLEEAGIHHHELLLVRLRDTLNPLPQLRYAALFWPNVIALRRLIREHTIEIVHVNGLMNLQAALAARLENISLVWHLNDVITPKLIRTAVLPLVRAWSAQIAVAAQAVGDHYFSVPNSVDGRLRVLYAPVDTARFHPRRNGSRIREEFGIPADSPVIGMVANFSPPKGHRYLLEAAAKIMQHSGNARFLLVGERLQNRHEYWDMLSRQTEALGLRNDVIFAGRRTDIADMFSSMDIYVHPSESEACPMAILEASASGLPVVATDVGGTRELVIDGETGFVIEPRQPSQIANAVIRLLRDPKLANQMGEAGASRMKELFSLEACVEQHISVYRTALRRFE
jgi:glycosyltransferase involved in cell wall biosynthesis